MFYNEVKFRRIPCRNGERIHPSLDLTTTTTTATTATTTTLNGRDFSNLNLISLPKKNFRGEKRVLKRKEGNR